MNTSVDQTAPTQHPGVTATSAQDNNSAQGKHGNLYALIIGIGKYPGFPDYPKKNLKGTIPDANDIEDLCLTSLGVPNQRIVKLLDEQATRAGIIKALENLAVNTEIKSDDPILIFYAGHGAQTTVTLSTEERKVQLICPYDFNPGTDQKPGSILPFQEQGILDLELAYLIGDIAKNKSDNILVIFDSCHSSSGTRNAGEEFMTRGITLPKGYKVSQQLIDKVFGGSRGGGVAEGCERMGMASHVLLAACKENEEASDGDRGVFTNALTTLLRDKTIDRYNLTYAEIIGRINLNSTSQHPQCEGFYKERRLFNGQLASISRQIVTVRKNGEEPGEYRLFTSEASGVMPLAIFAVYSDRNIASDSKPLGHIQVPMELEMEVEAAIKGNTSMQYIVCEQLPRETPIEVPQAGQLYAVQTNIGLAYKARLYLDLKDAKHKEVFIQARDKMQSDYKDESQVEFVGKCGDPHLVVTAQGDCAKFEIMDGICRRYGLKYMSDETTPITLTAILRVLRVTSKFYFHLRRTSNHYTFDEIEKYTNIKCYKLKTEPRGGQYLGERYVPAGPPLPIENGAIRITHARKGAYGFSITTMLKGLRDGLYAACYCFNFSDLTIKDMYQPLAAHDGGAVYSIPLNGDELTIGYGDSGTRAQNFTVKPGQEVDVCFIRLFVSTHSANWSAIKEEYSPLGSPKPETQGRGGGEAELDKEPTGWSAITIPVIVTRPSNSL